MISTSLERYQSNFKTYLTLPSTLTMAWKKLFIYSEFSLNLRVYCCYGQFFSIVLSAENNKSLFVPKGFAHGYLSLESDTLVHYKVDSYYDQSSEKGIRYDDPFLNIDWGIKIENIIISEKDRLLKPFQWIRKWESL